MKNNLPVLSLFCAAMLSLSAADAPSKPNILLILADDMGFSDPACFGGEIVTPNIDALARNGLSFTQFYNTARCWPSRAALMTGYYAQAVRRDQVAGVPSGGQGTRPEWARLLSDRLRIAGYRNYHSGKWHIDGKPLQNGFDHSYVLEDHDHNFNPKRVLEDDKLLPPIELKSGYYTSTAFADHAIKCLKEHAEKYPAQPFFEYLAFTVPHFPLQAPPEDIAKYRNRYIKGWDVLREERYARQVAAKIVDTPISAVEREIGPPYAFPAVLAKLGPNEINRPVAWDTLNDAQREFQANKMAIHAAMVDRMDQEIGRVIAQVKAMGALDNTLILFLSDNGASAEMMVRGDGHDPAAPMGSAATFLSIGPGWSTMCNTPYRRHKTWVHEGGIATPLIVQWPKGIAAKGELRRTPGHLVDVVPTLLELAGGAAPTEWAGKPCPPAPGISLVPLFTRDGSVAHDNLWWQHEGNRALRAGDIKIVAAGKDAPWELYNLRTDRAEAYNLADTMPDKVKELAAQWTKQLDSYSALARKDAPPGKGSKQPKKEED